MTDTLLATPDEAEMAWLAALTAPAGGIAELLHPDFVAVHGPHGRIQDREEFLADTAGRPPAEAVHTVSATTRHHGDVAIVSSLQQMAVPLVQGEPAFVIQAAVTRVWVRAGDGRWLLAHLQMARRFPPG